MNIGAHISAAGGLANAPANSAAIGGQCFQFFSRPPQGGKAPELSDATVAAFQANMKKYKQRAAYIHAPYFINLASTNNRIYYGSISAIRSELERGSRLGVRAMMTHLGSARDLDFFPVIPSGARRAKSRDLDNSTTAEARKLKSKTLTMVTEAITKILDGYTGSTQFLIESSAGSGLIIGDTFEEIAAILDAIQGNSRRGSNNNTCSMFRGRASKHPIRHPEPVEGSRSSIGICLDTQHAFASGYDLRTPEAVDATLEAFDRTVGLERLVCIHCNDSKTALGSHVDRHAHIGKGEIGLDGFHALFNHPKLRGIDFIIETPDDSKTKDLRKEDIAILKSLL